MIDSKIAPEDRNSKFLKKELMNYIYWRLNYPIVIDEFRYMDMFGVRRNGYSAEYEIKISRADFNKELKMITGEQPATTYNKDWQKWEKHAYYLNKTIAKNPTDYYWKLQSEEFVYLVPNEFYFYVPDYLCDYVVSKLQNLPYGVIKCGKVEGNRPESSYYSAYEIVKKAEKLHKNKLTDDKYRQLAHALTIRNGLLKPR